ncbi:MAG: flagellar biosynthetic protein FliR [Caulobacteraceae bacterium]|nr:flagellar biosynthetic protein FliR [Caulobacteraceae bacterium]
MNLTLFGVEIWSTALLFGRIGGMIMLLPGFGEPAVPGRIRLSFALALAIALGPRAFEQRAAACRLRDGDGVSDWR